MNKPASIWMAVLTVTAVVMAAILLSGSEQPAQAAMINSQANVTMMTTGAGGDEALVVMDRAQMKIIVYQLKGNAMEAVAGVNLARVP